MLFLLLVVIDLDKTVRGERAVWELEWELLVGSWREFLKRNLFWKCLYFQHKIKSIQTIWSRGKVWNLFINSFLWISNKIWSWNKKRERLVTKYRVSHSKVSKVILLWWGYIFRFMLIFWILQVHGIGAFMPNSSVFIFLMLRALYFIFFLITQSYTPNHAATSIY